MFKLFLLILLASCAQVPTTPSEPKEPEGKKVELWSTLYYMKEVKPSGNGVPLKDMQGQTIGPKLDRATWCLAAIEGTVKVSGTVYNYAGTKNPRQANCSHRPSERVRWKKSQYPYGIGNRNNPLRPFKSIATDPNFISSGSKVFIPQAVGVEYKFEGEDLVHDGYFYADDVGGAIKGNHIDVFLGSVSGGLSEALKINPFEFIKSESSETFEAYVIE